MHTVSNLGALIKQKEPIRTRNEKLMRDFERSGGVVTVCPPFVKPSIPEPAKITIKCTASKKKKKAKKGYVTNKAETRPKPDVKYSAKNAAILEGVRFGKLVCQYALEERATDRQKIWHCVCDCGGQINLRTVQLTKNARQHCDECNGSDIRTFGEILERQKEREGATV